MDPFEAIRKERKTGKLFCGTTKAAKSVTALAAEFGLKADASLYHQVDAEMARAIIVGILHRDLAYGNRLLSLARAEELAGQVMQQFSGSGDPFLDQRPVQTGHRGGTGDVALGSGDHLDLRYRRAHPRHRRVRLRLGRGRRLNVRVRLKRRVRQRGNRLSNFGSPRSRSQSLDR